MGVGYWDIYGDFPLRCSENSGLAGKGTRDPRERHGAMSGCVSGKGSSPGGQLGTEQAPQARGKGL